MRATSPARAPDRAILEPGADVRLPSLPLERLRQRARLLGEIRAFFGERNVMEVETPVAWGAAATDPHLEPMTTEYRGPIAPAGRRLFLQTSPESAMKQLLAVGSGSIYQICKVFRNGEAGPQHNPEFTLLEWYRVGFDLTALMDEMDALLNRVLATPPAVRIAYSEAFVRSVGVEPHEASAQALAACARRHGIGVPQGLGEDPRDRDAWLDLLMSHVVMPRLGYEVPVFVYDFPVSQAAQARVNSGPPPVARRFEAFYRGVELANAYDELTDAAELRGRHEAESAARAGRRGAAAIEPDRALLAALEAGLPACAGAALGVDRLLMVAAGLDSVREVLAFPLPRD